MIDDFKPVQPAKSLQDTKTDPKPAADFQTPEAVTAADDISQPVELADITTPETSAKQSWREKLDLQWPPRKKEYLIIAGTVILIIVLAIGGFLLFKPHKTVASKPVVKKIAPAVTKPAVIVSTLSGLPITDASLNKLPVTGVMIENSTDARPQSGLSQASVVFEAIAEGGITRFLALFQDTKPADVGPIRSARPYYAQWALGFDAGYAHVGGSPEALANIKAWNVRDLDQFYNGGSYHRISSRIAPHNVYTSLDTLHQLEASKGYNGSNFTGFARKPKEAPAKAPTAKSIDLAISGPVYNVHYDYDAATNTYKRSEGGAAHMDAGTNTQIAPKVVIAMVMPYNLEADGYHSDYGSIGSGAVYVFQDGIVTTGQWAKSSNTSQIVFTDSAGKPLLLNAGQTWLTAVTSTAKITSAP